uniref:Interleukin n=1 Tax=Amphilophus citrinellus TaxID=61819 RepID=A0A3Q0SVC5_AMPCI
MQRGRPALVSVFLSFVCIITVSSRFCSKDLVVRVRQASCLCHLSFILSLQQNCPWTTMKCFASEMDVLIDEWEVRPTFQRLRNQLGKLAKRFNQACETVESGCPQCEVLKEENATTFLESLLSTLENINSQHC